MQERWFPASYIISMYTLWLPWGTLLSILSKRKGYTKGLYSVQGVPQKGKKKTHKHTHTVQEKNIKTSSYANRYKQEQL